MSRSRPRRLFCRAPKTRMLSWGVWDMVKMGWPRGEGAAVKLPRSGRIADTSHPHKRCPVARGARMRFLSALMPREARFFDLFDRHGALIVEGANAVVELIEHYPDT